MTVSPAEHFQENSVQQEVHKPDWAAMRLLNQYRLLILLALASIYYLAEDQRLLGSTHPMFFVATHLGHLATTLCFVYTSMIRRPAISIQFFLQNYLDILFICALMFSSGGVGSGLGPLLLINIALLSQLSNVRHALLFAAIASIALLGAELLAFLAGNIPRSDFQSVALLGALLFLTAWLMTVPLRHLLSRQLATSTPSRVALDVRQIALLNDEIVRELDSGVLVVDHADNVQLLNDTARILLAAELVTVPMHLKKLSIDLFTNLKQYERSPTLQNCPFEVGSTGQSVLPKYSRLSTGGILIRLDDHAHILRQFQQLKLASLGQLSASIAHEIRNPLGAISHSIQLVEESDTLDAKDAELLAIARRHTQRINRIIDDVLQLSNRERVKPEHLNIDEAIELFATRFSAENALKPNQIQTDTVPCTATMDAGHLDQVLWNLASNALLHNEKDAICIRISCCYSGYGTVLIDLKDSGQGISDMDRDNLFEPFYSTHRTGTGLGLYITRELCELNQASIECLEASAGAHFRLTLASAQDMAA